jgi:ATP-dependent DNA helicase RecQ
VIDVLLGETTEKVERFGHDRISTFGIGTELDKSGWRHVARELTRFGYLEESPDLYRTLSVSARGQEALRSRVPVLLTRPREVVVPGKSRRRPSAVAISPPALPGRVGGADLPGGGAFAGELFEELRLLRKRLADERSVPAYIVFPDATLREMAARMPGDRFQLGQISGVGPAKLRDYADSFLGLIDEFRRRTGASPPASEPAGPRLL